MARFPQPPICLYQWNCTFVLCYWYLDSFTAEQIIFVFVIVWKLSVILFVTYNRLVSCRYNILNRKNVRRVCFLLLWCSSMELFCLSIYKLFQALLTLRTNWNIICSNWLLTFCSFIYDFRFYPIYILNHLFFCIFSCFGLLDYA